jgi:hypothetical protein
LGATSNSAHEVLVVTLGLTVPQDAISYAQFCDGVTAELLRRFRGEPPGIVAMVEDERNGETLSVRLALWNYAPEAIVKAVVEPWEVLEVETFGEVYPDADVESLHRTALSELL